MEEKDTFGELLAKSLNVGDLVQWSKWNSEEDEWEYHYGIITSVKNEIKSNRMVSISRVLPIHNSDIELEFFTVSLRLVSRGKVHSTIQ
jgi:hypothetical protein|tara:strand:+ start:673 stop:939 length:267 start_codon:yes stop_codon:yes gene_type:complete